MDGSYVLVRVPDFGDELAVELRKLPGLFKGGTISNILECIHSIARTLLQRNYLLSDAEIDDLLGIETLYELAKNLGTLQEGEAFEISPTPVTDPTAPDAILRALFTHTNAACVKAGPVGIGIARMQWQALKLGDEAALSVVSV
jgi:hypothetical protein